MPNISPKITDAELITQIQSSHLDSVQKEELVKLTHAMTEDEREELLALIASSNQEAKKVEKEHDEKLDKLNQEYVKKTNDMVHEEMRYARKEFEKADANQVSGDIQNLEKEIVAAATPAATIVAQKPRKKHTLRNLFFFLLFLALIAALALYGLRYLSSL